MKTTVFDHNECGRCGGVGHFNCWSHIYGGTCFRCHGNGFVLTRHGKADAARYRKAIDAATLHPITDVQVGDHVKLPSDSRYAIVKAIGERMPDTSRYLDQKTGEYKAGPDTIEITLDRKVTDLALASVPSIPRDMVQHDGYRLSVTTEIHIHPDSQLRNPEGERVTVKVKANGKPVTRWQPTNPRFPKAADFVTPIKARKPREATAIES